ncbi:MAG: DUF448 domain-containing protein [Candidatus Methylomirabilales bacterium]
MVSSDKAARKGPKRTCVGCGRRRGQAELVRFGGGQLGIRVQLDGGDGRGAYLCPDADCLEQAVRRRALQKALGAEIGSVSVQGLREAVEQAVLQKVQRLLGLARRAKRVVAGSRAVGRALDAGRVRLLLVSPDIFPWRGRPYQVEAERRGIPVVTVLSRQDLGAALAGPSRETVGLLDHGFAHGILQTLRYRIS